MDAGRVGSERDPSDDVGGAFPYAFRPSQLTKLDPSGLFGFADGVYTVVATLLVINLVIPRHVAPGQMSHVLWGLKWDFVAYAIGFLQALAGWTLMHRIGQRVRASDQWLAILVGVTLIFVVIVPFSTQVLAESFGDTANLKTAMLFVTVVGGISTSLYVVISMYVWKRGLYIASWSDAHFRWVLRFGFVTVGFWGAAITLSHFYPWLALIPVVWGYGTAFVPLRFDTWPAKPLDDTDAAT